MQSRTLTANIMLSPEQAAELIGVAASTLGIWRSTGRYNLPFVKAGSRVRYRAADVERFIERRTRNTFVGEEPKG